ncbi:MULTISPECIES: hypothetical protein [unclassified Pseudomonas]|uniref:hypothetical protein n=1 Tax=unclassified Pseudomonas TaxID=196821 RepID=UPI002AC97817|nr:MULTISPECIES: hypothetical protein [unclassified Pseudomonas]MEB0041308.1 hypothetical protein [Pseudomonas sp. MH10]MEB0075819.1 hypothetical protein [Pseudomonas sp. MH10out]MEB0102783.1 hypothetical protein [Pseudomonas sp. CCI3.2]MEB0131573.1 hypothetical protein [Pseudomonas sp. CCI2.4]MEB0156466.1 hypothetical protein [Pseudomonas sp. AH2 (2023)]
MRVTEANVSPLTYASYGRVKTSDLKHDPDSIPNIFQKSTVTISGEAHMRQRLFHSDNPSYRLPSKILHPSALQSSSEPAVNFLTQGDRVVLSKIYKFAEEQGADLAYVDVLGYGLANYRASARFLSPLNNGQDLDSKGHMLSYRFTDKDTATIKRVLASDAIKTTELDQGFIKFAMNKDYSVMNHHDFEFMEKVINKFSAKGDESPLGARFATHTYVDKNYSVHASKETYKFKNGKAQVVDALLDLGRKAKGKTGASKQSASAPPETLKDILRRIIFKAMGSNFRNGLPSLADFLMRGRH